MPIKLSSFLCRRNGSGFLKGHIRNAKKGTLCVLSNGSVSDLYLERSLPEQKRSLAAEKQTAQSHTCLLQIKRGWRLEENCSMLRILCTCLLVPFWKKKHCTLKCDSSVRKGSTKSLAAKHNHIWDCSQCVSEVDMITS